MISVALPAHMTCEEEGCTATEAVSVCLLGSGGFAFKPPEGSKWQVALPRGPAGLGAPFRTRCPLHATKLQVGPAGPRVVSAT